MRTDDILRGARNGDGIYSFTKDNLAEFVNLMLEAERHCCAELCEEVMAHYKEDTTLSTAVSQVGFMAAELCAVKIRGR
jgi:hypothetical protein